MLNKLIALEGGDGAGKSTQVQLVKKYLTTNSIKYDFFHFPMYGHNEFSEIISRFLRGEFGNIDEVDPYFVANIYSMDRFLFLPELQKSISENDVVLLDRYVFSNLAFQGAKLQDRESEKIKNWIYQFEFGFLKLPYPDLSIFLDVPIGIVKDRLENKREGSDRDYLNGGIDIHEANLEFQSRVRDNYLSLIGSLNYEIISCYCKEREKLLTPEELFEVYKHHIAKIIFSI
jgi:dTMP kinase